jgi:hypothetical protein
MLINYASGYKENALLQKTLKSKFLDGLFVLNCIRAFKDLAVFNYGKQQDNLVKKWKKRIKPCYLIM